MEQLGKYEILGRIGEGGFGTVWKGRDPFLKRTVAIKTCTSENDELRKRFLRALKLAPDTRGRRLMTVECDEDGTVRRYLATGQ